jgi:hypothetical protein
MVLGFCFGFSFLFLSDIDKVLDRYALEIILQEVAGFFPDFIRSADRHPVTEIAVLHALD